MNKLQQIAQRYLNLVFEHTSLLPISLGLMGLFYGVGFLYGDMHVNTNYHILEIFLSKLTWGILFLVYAVVKLLAPVYRLNTILKILCSFWGLWAWNYTIFSFIILDATPTAPAELILLVPLLLEVIDLALQIWEHKLCRKDTTW